jgi:hypothetical protein
MQRRHMGGEVAVTDQLLDRLGVAHQRPWLLLIP